TSAAGRDRRRRREVVVAVAGRTAVARAARAGVGRAGAAVLEDHGAGVGRLDRATAVAAEAGEERGEEDRSMCRSHRSPLRPFFSTASPRKTRAKRRSPRYQRSRARQPAALAGLYSAAHDGTAPARARPGEALRRQAGGRR